jgi:hypothetical protein
MDLITEEAARLVGYLTVANIKTHDYQPKRLVIKGDWRGKEFWPVVLLEVGDKFDGPWREIRTRAEKPSSKLIVERGKIATKMKVDLEAFRLYIGHCNVGRISLSTGDFAVFELNDLIPPEKPAR